MLDEHREHIRRLLGETRRDGCACSVPFNRLNVVVVEYLSETARLEDADRRGFEEIRRTLGAALGRPESDADPVMLAGEAAERIASQAREIEELKAELPPADWRWGS